MAKTPEEAWAEYRATGAVFGAAPSETYIHAYKAGQASMQPDPAKAHPHFDLIVQYYSDPGAWVVRFREDDNDPDWGYCNEKELPEWSPELQYELVPKKKMMRLGEDVPSDVLCARLKVLSDAVIEGKDAINREFTMRIPAEVDRDADLVLAEAAARILRLEAMLDMKPVEE